MPLLDHFVPPLSRTHPWRGFHAAWASAIARRLNQQVLPAGFYAIPLVDQPGPIEIDVATLHLPEGAESPAAVVPWEVPEPSATLTLDLPRDESIAVHILADDGEPRLTAAIELVSPRNKDRLQARQTFANKIVSYLAQGCSAIVVDTVTVRRARLAPLVLSLLGLDPAMLTLPEELSAIAYQVIDQSTDPQQLRIWARPLVIGQALPTLPLWLGTELSVPLELEATYQTTCVDLRIRQAG